MVETIQIAAAILRDTEYKYENYFRSINRGILHFINLREVDGWVTADFINELPAEIELEIKRGFNMIIEK